MNIQPREKVSSRGVKIILNKRSYETKITDEVPNSQNNCRGSISGMGCDIFIELTAFKRA